MHELHEDDKKPLRTVIAEQAKRIKKLEALLKTEHGTFFGKHTEGTCPVCDLLAEEWD